MYHKDYYLINPLFSEIFRQIEKTTYYTGNYGLISYYSFTFVYQSHASVYFYQSYGIRPALR